jgi:hypothetical protein
MSQIVLGPYKTFTAGAALAEHLRVKLSSGKLVAAGTGTSDEGVEIGTIVEEAFADGDKRKVHLRSAGGTTKMVAAGPITQGAAVYGAAGGKIDDAANGSAIGVALEAATAANDVIEVVRY